MGRHHNQLDVILFSVLDEFLGYILSYLDGFHPAYCARFTQGLSQPPGAFVYDVRGIERSRWTAFGKRPGKCHR